VSLNLNQPEKSH